MGGIGPAITIGGQALADTAWMDAARADWQPPRQRLDLLLAQLDMDVVGGTSLFRLARTPSAADVFRRLGAAGIIVRAFREQPTWLRFGLPNDADWDRLRSRLTTFASDR
jgi:cobalamin biosynthetic protein CobC